MSAETKFMEPDIIISFFALLISGTSILWNFLSHTMGKRNSKRDTLVICLQKYMDIMNSKSQAIEAKSVSLAKKYYRELFDLYWMEFELFQISLIDQDIYLNWLNLRYKEYTEERLLHNNEIFKNNNICYKNEWDILAEDYFLKEDPFVEHMELVHKNKIREAIKLAKKNK